MVVRARLLIAGMVFSLGLSSAALAQDVVQAATSADWSLYTDKASPNAFCFVTSEPKSTAPAGAKREAPRSYVSAWPKDGIKSEVSFRMGFPVRAAAGTAVIGDESFELFARGDRVFIKDATQELKLVDAMKRGSEMTVNVTSERGTAVTDTYSLAGITAALQKLQETCF
jgi:invasion protein IalB